MWNRGDGTGNACSDRAARGEADEEDVEDIGASTTKRLASHAHRRGSGHSQAARAGGLASLENYTSSDDSEESPAFEPQRGREGSGAVPQPRSARAHNANEQDGEGVF
jgi:hypothetical protein